MEEIGSKEIINKKVEELVKKWSNKGMENYWRGFSAIELERDLKDLISVVIREVVKVIKK